MPPGVEHQQAAGSARGTLNRDRIIRSAVELIEQQGLRQLTMRRLGAYLGVEAMALYHYVPGREQLLDGVVESVVDALFDDPELRAPTQDWPEYLIRLGHGVRRVALASPRVFPLIATRAPAAPWLRPPLRSLRWTESFLDTLRGFAFPDAAAVHAYRTFSSFLVGHLLLEVVGYGAELAPVLEPDGPAKASSSDLAHYPVVLALEPLLAEPVTSREFDEGLTALVGGLRSVLHR